MYNFFFFLNGETNNYMHSPHFIILLSVMFPHLQSIAVGANCKKRRPKCIIKQKYEYYTGMLPSSWKHPHRSWRKETGTNSHICMQSHVYMPKCEMQGWAWLSRPRWCVLRLNKSLVAICMWHLGHIQKLVQQLRIHRCLSSYFCV